ncbi:MAG: hypothetical protein SGPRY_011896, partial [Prymnesium sp.]
KALAFYIARVHAKEQSLIQAKAEIVSQAERIDSLQQRVTEVEMQSQVETQKMQAFYAERLLSKSEAVTHPKSEETEARVPSTAQSDASSRIEEELTEALARVEELESTLDMERSQVDRVWMQLEANAIAAEEASKAAAEEAAANPKDKRLRSASLGAAYDAAVARERANKASRS